MAANPQPVPEGQSPRKLRVHSRSRYLTKDELEALRCVCALAARTPEFGLRRQRGPWDAADGKKIVCLLCGVQLGNLGTHLGNKHPEELRLRTFDGAVGVAYKDYTYSHGWGRAPINSLYARERGRKSTAEYKQRQAQKSNHKTTRNVVEIAKSTQWYRDQTRDPRSADILRRQRLAKQQASLTPAEKETMIACRLCEGDGNPEYRFNTVRGHTKTIHGIPLSKYLTMFPGALVATEEVQKKFDKVYQDIRDYNERLENAEAEVKRLLDEHSEKLSLVQSVRQKLADPSNHIWMSPDEVAQALGIHRSTLFRHRTRYRFVENAKGWYSTQSVITYLRTSVPRKPTK